MTKTAKNIFADYAADPEALSIMQHASAHANLKGTNKMLTTLILASFSRKTQKMRCSRNANPMSHNRNRSEKPQK